MAIKLSLGEETCLSIDEGKASPNSMQQKLCCNAKLAERLTGVAILHTKSKWYLIGS